MTGRRLTVKLQLTENCLVDLLVDWTLRYCGGGPMADMLCRVRSCCGLTSSFASTVLLLLADSSADRLLLLGILGGACPQLLDAVIASRPLGAPYQV